MCLVDHLSMDQKGSRLVVIAIVVGLVAFAFGRSSRDSQVVTTTTTIPVNFEVASCEYEPPSPSGYIDPHFVVRFYASTFDGGSRVGRYRWFVWDKVGTVFAEGYWKPFRANGSRSTLIAEDLWFDRMIDAESDLFRSAIENKSFECRAWWAE